MCSVLAERNVVCDGLETGLYPNCGVLCFASKAEKATMKGGDAKCKALCTVHSDVISASI